MAGAEATFADARVAADRAREALVERGAEDADASLIGAESYLEGLRDEQMKLRVRRGGLTGELKSVSGVNEELAEADADRILPPASTTKIMTALRTGVDQSAGRGGEAAVRDP